MNLTNEKWFPVLSFTGEKSRISLSDLLDNRIKDIAYPRSDFQGAAWQMMIGILQCTVAPEDEDDWEEIWNEGIDPKRWEQALCTISAAFQFSERKPSFLQSFEPLDSENAAISGLLIDAPASNTLKLNKDHFVKRDLVERICPYCAVMALFAVQTNSPAGGSGYRVGMRGGGPLTTLVVPQQEELFPLWKKLWLNVLPQKSVPVPSQFSNIFPWLGPTKTSEKDGNVVTPENADELQVYWGMPRRLELDFTHTEAGSCDLCGEYHKQLLLEMRSKNYGVKYESWLHPFSPYRRVLKDPSEPWLALKGQPGGLSYKDWLGLILECEDKSNKIRPAKVVRAASNRNEIALWCFAWDMDNAKARCWYQHRIPLVNVSRSDLFVDVLKKVLSLASNSLILLRNALKSARFEDPKHAKVDLSIVDIAFWQETEPAFRVLLNVLARDPHPTNASTRQALRQWETELSFYLLNVFDRDALTDPDSPNDILLRQLQARSVLSGSYDKQKERKDLLALIK